MNARENDQAARVRRASGELWDELRTAATGENAPSLTGIVGAAGELFLSALVQGAASSAPPPMVLVVAEDSESADDRFENLRTFQTLFPDAGSLPPRGSAGSRKNRAKKRVRVPAPSAPGATDSTNAANAAYLVLRYPEWDVLPTEADRPDARVWAEQRRVLEELRRLRLAPRARRTTAAGKENGGNGEGVRPATPVVVVAPVQALLLPCPPVCDADAEDPGDAGDTGSTTGAKGGRNKGSGGDYWGGGILLRTGERFSLPELCRRLTELGYERTAQVEVRGEFARRGGILDVFPHAAEKPLRLDFLDDEIESVRCFDPVTQRSEEEVGEVFLPDFSPDRLRRLFSPRKGDRRKGKGGGGSEDEGGRACSLLDHLPAGSVTAWCEPEEAARRAKLTGAGLVSRRAALFSFAELRARAAKIGPTFSLSAEPGGDGCLPLRGCRSLERLQGNPAAHAADWRATAAGYGEVVVFCATDGEHGRCAAGFEAAGFRQLTAGPNLVFAVGDNTAGKPAGVIRLRRGRLRGGFAWPAAGLACAAAHEIFGRRPADMRRAARREKLAADVRPLSDLFELRPGDYVVHTVHGVARYLGLKTLDRGGRGEDYLTLEFADEVKLYVPAHQIGLVNKYVGGAGRLRLSKLGGRLWAGKKARAREAVREIAEDLLRVQAARREQPGLTHIAEEKWLEEFAAGFPFEPTADQEEAAAAVQADLKAPRPTDRLLCGDVGFGKTEIALRAAFQVAAGGRQVAVPAPTTLLAQQHGRTFTERFAGWPLVVETLSRLVPPKKQKDILARLAAGRVDVVVGTHRLLQNDVRFHDLGLVIIDEEQRFGVEHKEFFKRLRTSVDVLSLTATPIPRTLHMALLGLRDISNLTTPPPGRRAIRTVVARPDDDLLRRALLRELGRGGQVFAVHPRVRDIMKFRDRLAKLVPEAHFGVAHGRMEPTALEEVMEHFLVGELDVLVSTTIVESGLDIPTANTILVNEADRFGLAELHQLRGRVGRSEVQAYCLLLLPEKRRPAPDGLRRLRALEEFEELGAGFQLALKDLELRGAGNVLGAEQSGQIAEIGYDLYCKLLADAVRTLRGEPPPATELDVTLRLCGAAFLPDSYIEEEKLVLEFYRRLKEARTDEQVDALASEAVERFGPLPEPAARLFAETKLRRLAARAGVPYIGLDPETGRLVLKLHRWDLKDADRALRPLTEMKGVRVLDPATLSLQLTLRAKNSEVELHRFVHNILKPLAQRRGKSAPPPPSLDKTKKEKEEAADGGTGETSAKAKTTGGSAATGSRKKRRRQTRKPAGKTGGKDAR